MIPSIGSGAVVVAIDVGGTATKSALVDTDGGFIGYSRTETSAGIGSSVWGMLDHVEGVLARTARDFPAITPSALGVVAPGIIDDERGSVGAAVNLSWGAATMDDALRDIAGMPASFSHDVRAAGEAERKLGAAHGFSDFVMIAVGTGIAAAIFIDGRPVLRGGYAGEIGHAVVRTDGDLCACGARGCLETIASAAAIANRYRRIAETPVAGAREVLALVDSGDPVAATIWDDAIEHLAVSIAQLTSAIAPDRFVIGGGLADAGAMLLEPLRLSVHSMLSFHRRPSIVPAHFGSHAPLVGAALRARDLAATSHTGAPPSIARAGDRGFEP